MNDPPSNEAKEGAALLAIGNLLAGVGPRRLSISYRNSKIKKAERIKVHHDERWQMNQAISQTIGSSSL